MTRLSSSIAVALAPSAALTACQNDAPSTEPVMAPTFSRSGNDAPPTHD
jgi:hypothetical protein